MSDFRVTVVGDVGLDVVAKLTGPMLHGQDTRAAVRVTPGGAGGNTAAWLARYGSPVSLLARVGDDEGGRSAAAELRAQGVDCHFAVDDTLATCCVVVLVGTDGERTMLPDRGAIRALNPADVVLPDYPEPRQHLHLSGYVLLDEGSRAAGLAALQRARDAGWTTSVDPQSASLIAAVGADQFRSWLVNADVLLPNEPELAALGGEVAVLEYVSTVVVTHGHRGASWISGGERVTVAAPVVHQSDSTGAGDAFNAGWLSHWLAGDGAEAALQAGVQAGSDAAANLGARPTTHRHSGAALGPAAS